MSVLLNPVVSGVFTPLWDPAVGAQGRRRASAAVATYDQFVAAETARATAGTLLWASGTVNVGGGIYLTTVGAAGGNMNGSPWATGNSRVNVNNGSISRVVQHCFPDEATFLACAGQIVSITIPGGSSPVPTTAVNRCGYLSEGSEENVTAKLGFMDFRFFHPTLGAVIVNPAAGTGPAPYTP
jgi:hypothetical protein